MNGFRAQLPPMRRAAIATDPHWLALIVQFPPQAPGVRMATLRTLETLGAAALREGVYLLPDSPDHRHSTQQLSDYVASAGGHTEVTRLAAIDPAQKARLQALFDRSARYESILKTLEGIESSIGLADPTAIGQVLGKQRRELERVRALDFYSNERSAQAMQRLTALEQRVHTLIFSASPAATASATPQRYFQRTWATRRPLLADRLASAWLIRRFIDPEATLLWLDAGQDAPADSIGFAWPGAQFSNSRSGLTYDALLAHCRRDDDALARIGLLVRALDVGDRTLAETIGVETLLDGARRRAASDDALLRECERTFDLLYEAYRGTAQAPTPPADSTPARR